MDGPTSIESDKPVSKPKKKSKPKAKKKDVNDTMERFQDGRLQNSDSNDSFSSQMDIMRMNHDMKGFDMNSSGDHTLMQGHYAQGRMSDGLNLAQQGYNIAYNRERLEQNNSMNMAGNYEYANRFGQYTPHMMTRTNYPLNMKPGMVGMHPGLVPTSAPHMMPPNGQRIMSQHVPSGPSPTLNQLLQGQNVNTPLSNDYTDYSLQSHKGDMPSMNCPVQPGWPGQNQGMLSSYGSTSQATANGPYHSQSVLANNAIPQSRRHVAGYPNIGSPYPTQQISPNSPQQVTGRPSYGQLPNQQYTQTYSTNDNGELGAKPTLNAAQDSSKVSSVDRDSHWSSVANACTSASAAATPSSVHPSPSPVGSNGSRSDTPASLTGQAASPRSDGGHQNLGIQSPLSSHSPSPSHMPSSLPPNYGPHQGNPSSTGRMSGSPMIAPGFK